MNCVNIWMPGGIVCIIQLCVCAHFFRRRFQPGTWITPLQCHEYGTLSLALPWIRPRCCHRRLGVGVGRRCLHLMLAIAGGPVLSIWKDAGSQLQLISLRVAHRLADNDDDHDEHGQQDEDAANGNRHHCTVTHCRFVGCFVGEWLGGGGRKFLRNALDLWTRACVLRTQVMKLEAIREDVVCGLASTFWRFMCARGMEFLANENRF